MGNLIDSVFKQFTPITEAMHNDTTAIGMNMIGGSQITVSFIFTGACFIIFRSMASTKKGSNISLMIGVTLILCGLSRAFDVLCFYRAYQYINGVLKIITGSMGMATAGYTIAHILSARRKARGMALEEVKEKLDETQKMFETLNELKTPPTQ